MRASAALAGIALVATLASCSSDGSPEAAGSSPSPAPSPSATSGLSRLDGTISVTYTKAEIIQAGVSERDACENAGTHTLTLALGHWRFEQTPAAECGTVFAAAGTGSFSVVGDVASFHEPDAFGCSTDYSYRFAIQGDSVRFTVVSDDCEARRATFVTRPWTRS